MFWIIITLAAYFGFAAVAVIDKYLLAGPIKSPPLYAAIIGLLSFLAFSLWPFQSYVPSADLFALDVLAGALFVAALLFYFTALKYGQASRVVPLSSALVPLFTLVFAHQLSADRLSLLQTLGFLLLVSGGVLISLERKTKKPKRIITKVIWSTIISSAFFGLHFALMKQVFDTQPFIGGLIWSSSGKLIAGLIILGYLLMRGQIKRSKKKFKKPKSFGLFISGRIIGGLSGIGQNYAIALASVSIVTAMQGFQYAFLFLLIYFAGKKVKRLREDFSRKILIQKVIAAILLSLGLAFIYSPNTDERTKMELGITFSHTFATYGLSIDWQKAYDDIIEELPIKWLRLPVYWSEVQPQPYEWNLDILEYQLNKVQEKNIKVILSIGRKLPRWPECHIPEWAQELSRDKQQAATLYYISEVVKLYDGHPAVAAWQVENEPLFPFGNCPEPSEQFLRQEVTLVKSLSKKPVIISDSGELSTWLPEAKIGDWLGTTMYKQVFHETWGLIHYPIPSSFFKVKELFVKLASGRSDLEVINVELQAEPWGEKPIIELTIEEQLKLMNAKKLQENVEFAQKTGISPILLWGAEWWWWMRNVHNNDSLWETARMIFKEN